MTSPSQIIVALRPLLLPMVLFSLVTNLAVLVSPLFMMQVLDRVVASGNLNTLALLLMLAIAALATNACVEFLRDFALGKSGMWIENQISHILLSHAQRGQTGSLRHLSQLRDFVGGRGLTSAFDIPWIPIFLVALLLIHPLFLALVTGAAVLFALLRFATKLLCEPQDAAEAQARSASVKSLEMLESEGPLADIMSIGQNLANRYLYFMGAAQNHANQALGRRAALDSTGRFLRSALQIAALSTGAGLVAVGQLSAGSMIGASIIIAKTVGIIESAFSTWPQIIGARDAARALSGTANESPRLQTEIGELTGALRAENLTYPRGGGASPRMERISLNLRAGECLAILGESGSGKTTLLHALAGIDPAPIGNVFMDETDVRTLDIQTRDQRIGYLAQQAVFLSGTIAENISRFAQERDDEKILAAAKLAGVHGMISALPDAYDTNLAKTPYLLSAGQKQRIALARAIYEPPAYLFLDEPNALLDHQGERQLGDAIARLKRAGTTIVVVVHRMAIAQLADKVLVMERGHVLDYGARSEILGRMANGHRRIKLPIAAGAHQDLEDWVARQFLRDGDEDFRSRAATIALELYNFATENGPKKPGRMLGFEFNFIDDVTCSITLSEPLKLQLQAKVSKVRKAVEMAAPEALSSDEQALATVMKLASKFEHRANDKESAFFAKITQNTATPTVMQ